MLRARKEARPAVAHLIAHLADGPQPSTLNLSASALAAPALVPPPHRRHLDGLVQRLGNAQGPGDDGGFDRMPPPDPIREERSLIGLRALQVALED